MPRLTTSDGEAAIRTAIATARSAEGEAGWIAYLARDPRQLDLKGNVGWPIYVGQSKEFGTRVRNHLRKSEKLSQAHDSVRKRISEILHDGHVSSRRKNQQEPLSSPGTCAGKVKPFPRPFLVAARALPGPCEWPLPC
jgi:hypothetical protein